MKNYVGTVYRRSDSEYAVKFSATESEIRGTLQEVLAAIELHEHHRCGAHVRSAKNAK